MARSANPIAVMATSARAYRAAAAVRAGQTPYRLDEHGPMGVYPYAPAYAYLLVPLTYLDYLWAFRLCFGLNWLATTAAFALGLKLVDAFRMTVGPCACWRAFQLPAISGPIYALGKRQCSCC